MTEKELNHGFGAIAPSAGKKEDIWKNIEMEMEVNESMEKRKPGRLKKTLNILAATAAVFAILAIPSTIFADEIKDFFAGFLSQDKQLVEIVETNVFEATDSTSHIKMEVKELVSDGHTAMATVVYTALDEKGQEWFDLMDEREKEYRNSIFSLLPGTIGKDDAGNDVFMISASCSHGYNELKELRTDDSRTYILVLSSYVNEAETLVLDYPMPSKISNLVEITPTGVENYRYTMVKTGDDTEDESTAMRPPVFLEISNLSWSILGNNNGVYEHYGNTWRSLTTDDEDYKPSAEIYFSDGKSMSLEMNGFWDGSMETLVEGKNIDLLVCSGDFINHDKIWSHEDSDENNDNDSYLTEIDPSQIVSVKLNGIMYDLR